MGKDELLTRLGEIAREEEEHESERLDSRWDDLAAGRLSESERKALAKEAEESPAGRAAWAAFAPLSADFRAQVAREIRSARDSAASAEPASERAPRDEPLRFEAPPSAPRRRIRLGWAAVAAAVLAVVVALFQIRPPEPIPDYSLDLAEGARSVRSGTGEPAGPAIERFVAGDRFDLALAPATAVDGPIEVRAYRLSGSRLAPWPVEVDYPAKGSARIAGVLGRDLQLPEGETTLLLLVGRPASLPAAPLDRLGELGLSPSQVDDRECRRATESWLVCRLSVAMTTASRD